jgi:diadenosine tetraphosphate (Ap4A) HIT family hydrolase
MEERFERYHPDMEAFHREIKTDPCFVCEIAASTNDLPQHFVYGDARVVTFLDAYPRAYGYTLVAPKEHREQVTGNFTMEEYLDLQQLVYRVTEAVREEVGAEWMYIYSYGSNQGAAHVHWHVVPMPPGGPTTSSRAPGRVGARACSRYPPRRWRTWQDVSAAGSDRSTQPDA